jgi:hypothetical protein
VSFLGYPRQNIASNEYSLTEFGLLALSNRMDGRPKVGWLQAQSLQCIALALRAKDDITHWKPNDGCIWQNSRPSPAETPKLIQKKNERGEHRAAEHDRPVAQIETKEANIHRT